jgi:L-lysine 2,3-aminomutase
MHIKMTPHILSRIDWLNPLDDPLRIQFLPLSSEMLPDHPRLTLDSLHETEDSRMSLGQISVEVVNLYTSRTWSRTPLS